MALASGRHPARLGVGLGVGFASTYIEAFHRSFLHKTFFMKSYLDEYPNLHPRKRKSSGEPQKTKTANPTDQD
jgi:hypothetical protein